MGKHIEGFEDLEVWKEGMELTKKIPRILRDCNDYPLRDQFHRAAISVPWNIAEGFERQTNEEFVQFLYIAKDCCGELRTQLYLAIELQIINEEADLVRSISAGKSRLCYSI